MNGELKMINVIGLGYIGLPTALMMAAHGVEVVGTDYNKELVATLNAGKTTFKEDGLDELFAEAVSKGIKFTTEYQVTDTYIVSVPTPYDKFSKKVDACYVVSAVKSVMAVCPKGATVVIESTVSPGTIDKYVRPAIEENGFVIGKDINLVHAPERIIPGNMVYELLHNNRTIGADDKVIGEKIKDLYASFCQGEIVVTDIRTAEMTKVVENTFRAVNIAFANVLSVTATNLHLSLYTTLSNKTSFKTKSFALSFLESLTASFLVFSLADEQSISKSAFLSVDIAFTPHLNFLAFIANPIKVNALLFSKQLLPKRIVNFAINFSRKSVIQKPFFNKFFVAELIVTDIRPTA